jgi:potassium/hydrogen antiporter
MDRTLDGRLVRRFVPVLLVALSLGCEVDPNGRYLMMIGALFVLGAGGEVVFAKTQIPDVVWLILAGVVLRVTNLIDPAVLDPILPLFATLTLIVVLFDGGRQIVIYDLLKAAPRATAMALLSFVFASLGVAVILQLAALTGLLPRSWTFLHSLMTGAILGGSSSLVIMPSMALAKVEAKVSNLVGLESALTDALCVVIAVVFMNLISSGNASGTDAMLELGENFGLAVLIGLIAGWGWMPVLRALSGSPHAYPITLAALLFLTVIVSAVNGNAAMAVLTFSVVVGNAEALMKMVGFSLGDTPLRLDDTVVTVHTQFAFIIKSFFFTYIGLMLAPPWSLLLLGIVVGFVLFGTRIPAVMLVAREPDFEPSERKMVAISLPRGMAAGVLATMPATYGIEGTEKLPSLVFAAVVTSIGIFAVGFRKVRSEAVVAAGVAGPTQRAAAEAARGMPDGMLPPGYAPPVDTPVSEPPAAASPEVAGPPPAHAMPDGRMHAGTPNMAAQDMGAPQWGAPPVAPDVAAQDVAAQDVAAPQWGAPPVTAPPTPVSPQTPEPPRAPRSDTAYGIAPPPVSSPVPRPQAETPTSPGIPLTTLHGFPAVRDGPPAPEARPGMGGSFVPSKGAKPGAEEPPE